MEMTPPLHKLNKDLLSFARTFETRKTDNVNYYSITSQFQFETRLLILGKLFALNPSWVENFTNEEHPLGFIQLITESFQVLSRLEQAVAANH